MLMLSRREGQRIMIGEDIVIKIADIRRNSVVIGVEAPCMKIAREEVLSKSTEAPVLGVQGGVPGI